MSRSSRALYPLSLCITASAALSTTEASRAMSAVVQPVLDLMVQKWNMSFSFGYIDAGGTAAAAAGYDSIWDKTPLLPETLIPVGSVTKPWTATRVMQYVETGRIALRDPAYVYVDPPLRRLWGSSLSTLWGNASSNVTIEHLLGMRSGFADYTDAQLEVLTLTSNYDPDPFAYLASAATNGYVCPTGSCAAYSGANYVLLGLVLLELDGGWSWEDLDQRAVIPQKLRASGRYNRTMFARLGRCAQYTGVAHQYAEDPSDVASSNQTAFVDLELKSCLNGWTMGNIATTALDLATFFYDLHTLAGTGSRELLSNGSLDQMTQYHNLSDSWCYGPQGPGSCRYGLGLFKDQLGHDFWYLKNSSESVEQVGIVGHPGEDWGSGVSPCGYNEEFGFGVCIAYTSLVGMNCSLDYDQNYNYAVYQATCLIYDAVLGEVGGPRLNCSVPEPAEPASERACNWELRVDSEGTRSWAPNRTVSPIGVTNSVRSQSRASRHRPVGGLNLISSTAFSDRLGFEQKFSRPTDRKWVRN